MAKHDSKIYDWTKLGMYLGRKIGCLHWMNVYISPYCKVMTACINVIILVLVCRMYNIPFFFTIWSFCFNVDSKKTLFDIATAWCKLEKSTFKTFPIGRRTFLSMASEIIIATVENRWRWRQPKTCTHNLFSAHFYLYLFSASFLSLICLTVSCIMPNSKCENTKFKMNAVK